MFCLPNISTQDEIDFLKSIIIPSFYRKERSEEARVNFMIQKANRLYKEDKKEIADELYERFGEMVKEEAEKTCDGKERLKLEEMRIQANTAENKVTVDELTQNLVRGLNIQLGHKPGTDTAAQSYQSCEKKLSVNDKVQFHELLDRFSKHAGGVWLEAITPKKRWEPMTLDAVGTFRNFVSPDMTGKKSVQDRYDWETNENMGTQGYLIKAMMKILNGVTRSDNSFSFPFHMRGLSGSFGTDKINVKIQNWPNPLPFKVATLGNRKPDCPFYVDNDHRSPLEMSFLVNTKPATGIFVENSGISFKSFSDDSLGELHDFLLALYEIQPFRPFVIGVLTDTRGFQFMKMTRDRDNYPITVSDVYCGPEAVSGWQILFGMMASAPADLGFCPVAVKNVTITDFLASGGHSHVLRGTMSLDNGEAAEATNVIVKVWNEVNEVLVEQPLSVHPLAAREFRILQYLASKTSLCVDGLIPTVLDLTVTEDGQRSVVIETPIAQPIRASCFVGGGTGELMAPAVVGRQLVELLNILKSVHRAGVAHRDVKPSNIMINGAKLLLVDFDSACEFHEILEDEWWGTAGYFDQVYDAAHGGRDKQLSNSLRLRRADLRCLVRTSYSLIHKMCPPSATEKDAAQLIHMFWEERFVADTIWGQALAHIDAWDGNNKDIYLALETLFKML